MRLRLGLRLRATRRVSVEDYEVLLDLLADVIAEVLAEAAANEPDQEKAPALRPGLSLDARAGAHNKENV